MNLQEKNSKVIARNTRFITVTGGVCSSIGKGVLVSSVGVLLKNAGYTVAVVKWDPYLNVDPGTMSPLEHGEVFVTADGAETDLDLGHYERMLQVKLLRTSSVSSGQIYQEVLQGERQGEYLGRCIQLVPHVVDAIKNRLYDFALATQADFVLTEIGGTVGDMEGTIFLEAVRQLRHDLGRRRLLHFHLSYVPYLSWAHEIKTKPTQHSVNELKGLGLIPDALALRAEQHIEKGPREKLAVMCGVDRDYIFQVLTHKPMCRLFLDLEQQGLCEKIQEYFGIENPQKTDLSAWHNLIDLIEQSKRDVTIGLVAKYVGSNDPYISVIDAIRSAGYWHKVNVHLVVIEAEKLEQEAHDPNSASMQELKSLDGIIVPGGFDKRGIEGKIIAARWAREQGVPYLGLCLGMQIMLIEYARSVLGMSDANSTEFNKETHYPVVSLLAEQRDIESKGATMRLGTYPCTVLPGTKAHQAYGKELVLERHRHRYEFNNDYRSEFEKAGVTFSGIYTEKNLVEIAEIPEHPFMLGTQAHPEFKSSPLQVHPLFQAFMSAVLAQLDVGE
ncbi:MAG TPA: CTP synthase [Candidatus Dependentiae bacterium]|nr:CTP synthase [Candidatus Dependentiae bacterium]